MNLIKDPWIAVEDGDGVSCIIRPTQALDKRWCRIVANRPDLLGAAYQFLIGLLQLTIAPEDEVQWEERLGDLPSEAELDAAFAKWQPAFEASRFMQSLDVGEGAKKSVNDLFIDSPGQPDMNTDRFVAHDRFDDLPLPIALLALYALQINAPAGGAGHRVSVRSGGPLTTLLLPNEVSLGRMLWMNILPDETWGNLPGNSGSDEVLPWMHESRLSAGGEITTPQDVHPLQVYWCMPRRIRLNMGQGEDVAARVVSFHTAPRGTNYGGEWRHPLTPYYYDAQGHGLPIRPKEGNFGYRHWVGLLIGEEGKQSPALIVHHGVQERLRHGFRIWAFGYGLNNAEPRCWVDATMPTMRVLGHEEAIRDAVDMADQVARTLYQCIRRGWTSDGKTSPGAYRDRFWAATEPEFYRAISQLLTGDDIKRQWHEHLKLHALRIFDDWAFSRSMLDARMKRIAQQRRSLLAQLANIRPRPGDLDDA